MTAAAGPDRFRQLARRAGRDHGRSRAAVAILRADAAVARALDRALGRAGLTLPQFNVLMELAAASDAAMPLYELNSRLVTSAPNMSWLSTKMEQAGLVTKTRDASDARVVVLALTESAWAALEVAVPLVSAVEAQLLQHLTVQELRTLADLLGRLVTSD